MVLRHNFFPSGIFYDSALTGHEISKDMERAAVWSDGDGDKSSGFSSLGFHPNSKIKASMAVFEFHF